MPNGVDGENLHRPAAVLIDHRVPVVEDEHPTLRNRIIDDQAGTWNDRPFHAELRIALVNLGIGPRIRIEIVERERHLRQL